VYPLFKWKAGVRDRERDYSEISAVYAMPPQSKNPFSYPAPW